MKQDISKSIEACAAHYGEQVDAMRTYLAEGEKQALSMSNRGPILLYAAGNFLQVAALQIAIWLREDNKNYRQWYTPYLEPRCLRKFSIRA
jgi:vacuolar-type H+-ATPase subunit C/Vma6